MRKDHLHAPTYGKAPVRCIYSSLALFVSFTNRIYVRDKWRRREMHRVTGGEEVKDQTRYIHSPASSLSVSPDSAVKIATQMTHPA